MSQQHQTLFMKSLVIQILCIAWTACAFQVDHLAARRMASLETRALPSDANEDFSSFRRDLLAGISATASAYFLPSLSSAVPADLKEEYRQGTAALSGMDSDAPVPKEAYRKLPNGIIFANVREGKGAEVKVGSKVNLQWVLRKSNGYFVDSSERNQSVPFIFTVGDGTAIVGVDQGIVGMKEGGVRRILIPPSLAYAQGLEDGKPGPLPIGFGPRQQMRRVQDVRKDVPGEYVYLELLATRVR